MQNVSMTVNGNTLTITVDLQALDFLRVETTRASGKTMLVATTSGNVPVPGAETVSIGVNAYTKQ